MRTSRSPSSIARSSNRMAEGLEMAVSASTTASLSPRSSDASRRSMPSGAPGSFRRPASFTISSWAAPCPLQDGARLSQDDRHRAEIGGAQQVGDEVFDDGDELGPDGAVGLQFEQIEQHREDVAAQVLRVLPLDVLLEVLDLAFFEKVQRGVEVVDRDQALT